jgi:hypothetical protein
MWYDWDKLGEIIKSLAKWGILFGFKDGMTSWEYLDKLSVKMR